MSAQAPGRRLIVGLLLCVVAIAFENIAVLTAMPAAARDLGDLSLYAWAFTAFVIAQLFSIVAGGRWCDRVGPTAPLIGGFPVFAAGLALAGAAPTMVVLLAARFVQGLGAGVMNVAIMVVIARLYDARERATIMTWFSGCWMVPAFVGPSVAAWVAETFSWHWVFWGLLPLVFVAGLLVLGPLAAVRLPVEPSDDTHRRHLGLAAGVAAGVALIQVAGQNLQPISLATAAVGLVALWRCLPPLMPRGFSWLGTGVSATVSARTLSAGVFFGAEAFIPLMLIEVRGLSLFEAGTTVTIGSLGWMLGSWLQSRPWLRLHRHSIITVGVACIAGGLAVVAAGAWLPWVWLGLLAAGWIVAGVGMGLATASTSLAVMQVSEGTELGRNTSALQVGEALGSSLFAGLAGTWFAFTHLRTALTFSFGGLLSLMVLGGIAATFMAGRIGPVRNHSLAG